MHNGRKIFDCRSHVTTLVPMNKRMKRTRPTAGEPPQPPSPSDPPNSDCDEDFTALPCEPPDVHSIDAACGWLELGDAASARKELADLDASLKKHPDVLLLSWDIDAALGDWEAAYATAQEMMRVIPDDIRSWLNRSIALRHAEGGGAQAAYDALLTGERHFDLNSRFYLHLARHACQAGKLQEARLWLCRANELGCGGVKDIALDEPDLEPIWEYVVRLDK
jgi:tetratricopeptide (TPR) repeat protein